MHVHFLRLCVCVCLFQRSTWFRKAIDQASSIFKIMPQAHGGICANEDGHLVAWNPKKRNIFRFQTESSCEMRPKQKLGIPSDSKADVNARDQNNMTPLMGCVVGGGHEMRPRSLAVTR